MRFLSAVGLMCASTFCTGAFGGGTSSTGPVAQWGFNLSCTTGDAAMVVTSHGFFDSQGVVTAKGDGLDATLPVTVSGNYAADGLLSTMILSGAYNGMPLQLTVAIPSSWDYGAQSVETTGSLAAGTRELASLGCSLSY